LRTEVRPGDLVLFGSSSGGNWLLDTVIVIDKRLSGPTEEFGPAYARLVTPTIHRDYRPIVGRPYSDADEPFSFSPAMNADNGHNPFPRPVVNSLLGRLRSQSDGCPPSPSNAQALVICTAVDGVRKFWKDFITFIEEQGLVLGTAFYHPTTTALADTDGTGGGGISPPIECCGRGKCC
jgi:hypothetical protein